MYSVNLNENPHTKDDKCYSTFSQVWTEARLLRWKKLVECTISDPLLLDRWFKLGPRLELLCAKIFIRRGRHNWMRLCDAFASVLTDASTVYVVLIGWAEPIGCSIGWSADLPNILLISVIKYVLCIDQLISRTAQLSPTNILLSMQVILTLNKSILLRNFTAGTVIS